MYCPKCNLHSEEYVDMCPLCDGPMEVDEVASGVMKTPTLPDKEGTEELPGEKGFQIAEEDQEEAGSLDKTVALEVEQAAIVAEAEKERLRLEKSEEKEAPPSQEDEPLFEQKRPSYEEASPPAPPAPSDRKRLPLWLGGGIVIILILAVSGYFLFSSPEKVSKPDKQEVAVAQKRAERVKPVVPRKKPAETKQKKKKAEPEPTKREKTAALVPPEKVEPPVSPKTEEGAAIREAVSARPLPEEKEPPVPVTISEIPPTKPAVTAPTPAPLTPTTPQPAVAVAEPERKLAEAPGAFPATLPSSNESGPYSVHVGSFRSQSNAFLLRDKLQEKGFPAFCKFVTIPEKGEWYRVSVGFYSMLKDAQQVASVLESKERVPALVLKRQ